MTDSDASVAAVRNSAAASRARLFFALWPDERARERLASWAAALHGACGGRRIRDESLHVTLVFLGEVPLERLCAIREMAAQTQASNFVLRFSRPGVWPRKRLVWAAPDDTPASLQALVGDLVVALRREGFAVEQRRYFPHVTLLRDALCTAVPSRMELFDWEVKTFVLARSTLMPWGSRYEVIDRWLLSGSH